MTLIDQLHATLSHPPYSLPECQHADFTAYLSGLPETPGRTLTDLSIGDRTAAQDRLTRERDPRGLVERWVAERARQQVEATFTPEMAAAEGARWLL